MSNCVGKTCTSLSDCLVASKKIYELDEHAELNLTSRERQLLLLLASEDTISRKAGDRLAKKVSVKALLNAGLLEQSNGCINFDNLLQTYSKPNQQAKPQSGEDIEAAIENEYHALYKKMSQKLEDIYDSQSEKANAKASVSGFDIENDVIEADKIETDEQSCCTKTDNVKAESNTNHSSDTPKTSATSATSSLPQHDGHDDMDPIVFLLANAS